MEDVEWLETNGIGGFASSTITGMNTRRYHGLLIAATQPPVGRMLLLSKVEESLVIGDRRYELSTNRYPGIIHPRGFEYLQDFRLDPCPTFIYEVEGITLTKRVYMNQGENTTVIEYAMTGEASLELRPLIAFRDYHSTTHENAAINANLEQQEGVLKLQPYPGLPPLYLHHGNATVSSGSGWYRNFEFERERERGLDFQEDLYNPVLLTFTGPATLIASTEPDATAHPPAPKPSGSLIADLTRAADQFIVRRGERKTIIAGYHWFSDWGRDAMIALPGLTLVTGRFEIARQILESFAEVMDRGMIPNRFPDAGQVPEYNTVDATLWFFEAVRAYTEYTGDYAYILELFPKLKESIDWHLRGTRYGIHVDTDALLACGEPGVQLTWMDSKIGDWVVTPRHGKPVEIQALWYNALRIMQGFAQHFADTVCEMKTRDLADRARESFRAQFWNEAEDCLYDVANDPTIRPNQIFAVSLPHSMLENDRAQRVVDVVERELLTPMGLRTLSPRDSRYRGRYEGDVPSRDGAYHQGTVWPWLMGPFITAYLRVHGEAGRARATDLLDHFREVMKTGCLGQIPELADGDAPHQPQGAIAQAWSVGELLRVVTQASRPAFGGVT